MMRLRIHAALSKAKRNNPQIRMDNVGESNFAARFDAAKISILGELVVGAALRFAPGSLSSPVPELAVVSHGGEGWIRTSVRLRGQIYSLLPLTTRPPLQVLAGRANGVPTGRCQPMEPD